MTGELIQLETSEVVVIPTPETSQDTFDSDIDFPFRAVFYPLGYAVEIITNEPAVLEAASDSFCHTSLSRTSTTLQVRIGVSEGGGPECPPEPTRHQYNHLFSMVANADNQAILDLKRQISFVWLQKATVDNRLYFRYNFLEKTIYLLLGSSVVTDLHAACVSNNGKGILLCGDSGAGKSTLAYACARAGWTYTSDDTSYLINGSEAPEVIGHAHRVRFRPDAKNLFSELENYQLTQRLEGKPSLEIPTSELPGIVTASETRVHAIVYLNRGLQRAGKLTLLPESTATQRARKALCSVGEIRAKHEKILQILSTIPTYELQYCELDHAIYQLDLLTKDV